jgi:hypothetical protein
VANEFPAIQLKIFCYRSGLQMTRIYHSKQLSIFLAANMDGIAIF